jgi:hypothetical protein
MINLTAPIIPYESMAGLKLYSSIKELKPILMQEGVKEFLFSKFLIRYEIENQVYLFFNLINGKLFKITALNDYKGTLFNNIKIGMSEAELLKFEPSFEYDDFEEVFVSHKGAFIETDPLDNTVMWISIFIKELENPAFENGDW